MIKSLTYEVTFPLGRTLKFQQCFDKGLTAITGPNEAGKSYVVEMIRFSLFGTSALRGKADIDCTMTFSARGETYRVWRTMDKAQLFHGEELLTNGVRATNNKLLSILGFDLSVFDAACVTNQGQVERLGDMKPAERKRMVDEVIGVNRLDELSKWCAEQGALLGREIEVLERGHVEPVKPEKPQGYHCSSALRMQVDRLREAKQELDQHLGWLSHVRTEPVCPPRRGLPSAAIIERELRLIDEVQGERKHLLSLPVIDFDPEAVRAQWDAYDAWEINNIWNGHNPRPTLSRKTVVELVDIEKRRDQHTRLSTQLARYASSPVVTCPHCAGTFCLEHETITDLKGQIHCLGDIPSPA